VHIVQPFGPKLLAGQQEGRGAHVLGDLSTEVMEIGVPTSFFCSLPVLPGLLAFDFTKHSFIPRLL
jgi:hypothetical protein